MAGTTHSNRMAKTRPARPAVAPKAAGGDAATRAGGRVGDIFVVGTAAELLGVADLLAKMPVTSLHIHDLVTVGLPSRSLDVLISQVPRLKEEVFFNQALGMSHRTLQRKKAGDDGRLSREQSDRAWGFAEILTKATKVFGSQAAAEAWLEKPQPSLDRRKPIELLETSAGRTLVDQVLGRIDYGVYT